MNSGDLITGNFSSLKAVTLSSGNLSREEQEKANAVTLDNISRRTRKDWIEKVASWVAFAILCGVAISLVGCIGTRIPACDQVHVDGKIGVSNTPCLRQVQYKLDSEKIPALCVSSKENVLHCQEVPR